MAKKIEPNPRLIGDYLKLENNAKFIIPAYQRAYSWGIEQCDKLWNNLIEYSDNDNVDPYFFGTVIISCQEDDKELLLIDGQQRTTTFFLLLKAMLLKVNEAILHTNKDEDSKKLCSNLNNRRKSIISILYKIDIDDVLELDENQDEQLLKSSAPLLRNDSIREQKQTKKDFEAIIRAADFDEAESNVEKVKYKRGDNRYSNFFRNFKFFYDKIGELTPSELNSYSKTLIEKSEVIEIKSWNLEQAITMFNSLNSDNLPLNDADIISSKLYESAEKVNNAEQFTELWENFHSQTHSLEEKKIADMDQILMQYMYYERARRGETTSETGALITTIPGLRRYFIDINKDALNSPIAFSNNVIKLTKLWERINEYPCVQVLLKLNENAKLYLASYILSLKDDFVESDIKPVVESLIKLFTIMEVGEIGYSSSKFKSFLLSEQLKMIDTNTSIAAIENDFKEHITKNWTSEQIQQDISEYNKHMLVYLNEYLYAKNHNLPFDLLGKYDIEHIMPNSGRDKQTIRREANIENAEEFENIVNKLGNKILLESQINQEIGDEWFKTKVSTTLEDKSGYIDSKYPLARALVEEYRDKDKVFWAKEDIIDATEKASERITNFIFS